MFSTLSTFISVNYNESKENNLENDANNFWSFASGCVFNSLMVVCIIFRYIKFTKGYVFKLSDLQLRKTNTNKFDKCVVSNFVMEAPYKFK